MTDLFNFNKEDVLTLLTKEQAKVGDKGYFGNNLTMLDTNVKRGEVHSLVMIYDEDFNLYPFEGDHTGNSFALFLLADKVKNKEPSYRPFNSLDELFDFFYPPKDDVYNQIEKAEILLGKKIILKKKENGQINALFIQHIKFNSDNSNIYLNNVSLDYIFHIYDIEKDDKWVTFGILEE